MKRESTLLIVDDQPANIRVLGEIFQDEYRVIWATSGAKALELAVTQMPKLILLDIMMPNMDGYAVFAKLREIPNTKDIPVIFVTSLDQEGHEVFGLELGAVDYITKPINPGIARLRVRNQLELKKARDYLEKLSTIDGLTGIANRRFFDNQLVLEWQRSIRSKAPLTLIMLDIDFFKPFNDNYGHCAGDECLRKVASSIAGSMRRTTDIAARYGGEEFVCLLPDTTLEGAVQIGEQLRSNIVDLKIPHDHSQIANHVTLSVGCATATPSLESYPKDLLILADTNLYRAKKNGRNRVCA